MLLLLLLLACEVKKVRHIFWEGILHLGVRRTWTDRHRGEAAVLGGVDDRVVGTVQVQGQLRLRFFHLWTSSRVRWGHLGKWLEKEVKSKAALIYLSRASRSILRVRIEDPM